MENRFNDSSTRLKEEEKPYLLFSSKHYAYLGLGLLLVVLGFLLMWGGAAPDADTWQPEEIYSFRRITLAPIVVLLGLVVVIFGIFAKHGDETNPEV